MGKLTATEHDGHFDLVPFLYETKCVLQLDVKIVLFNVGAKLNFFDVNNLLLLLRFLFPLLLFIAVLTEVHDAAHRRLCLRRNLDEVKMLFFGHTQCVTSCHDAQLFSFGAGHAHFTDANFLIDA